MITLEKLQQGKIVITQLSTVLSYSYFKEHWKMIAIGLGK